MNASATRAGANGPERRFRLSSSLSPRAALIARRNGTATGWM
jgi:hypothetical protein